MKNRPAAILSFVLCFVLLAALVTNGVAFANRDDAVAHFAPMSDCSRAQIVTFLWRQAEAQ